MSAQNDQIQAMFEELSAAWKANDGAAVADFYTGDGTLVNPFGERAEGRDALAAMYAEYFGGMLAGTSTSISLSSVRGIDDNVAFIDGQQTISAPDGSPVLVVHLAALVRRDGERWRFVDARPYTYATAPES